MKYDSDMVSKCLIFLVLLSSISRSLQDTNNNQIESQDESPLAAAAAEILKEQNIQNIGSMVNSFMQSGSVKKLEDVLQNVAYNDNAGQLLEGIGNLIQPDENSEGSKRKHRKHDSVAELLGGLSSLLGAIPGNDAAGLTGATTLLQIMGSLLGSQGREGGVDGATLSSLVNMFVNSQTQQKNKKEEKSNKLKENEEQMFNMADMLALAGGFLNQDQNAKKTNSFMDLLPMILQTINAFTGPEAQKRAKSHSEHSWLLPPFLEKLHIIFDNFLHSDMSKFVFNSLGVEKIFKVFADDSGKFSFTRFGEMIENHSFRKHWISMVTDRVVDILKYASEPEIHEKYLKSAQLFFNSFIKNQGFPNNALFDAKNPAETISVFINYAVKKYLDVEISSKEYVTPIIEYMQDLQTMVRSKEKETKLKELSDKLADTINLEIIEPIARVNRAYRFVQTVPQCDRYVFCLVNEKIRNDEESLPALKQLLYKGSSLLAAWFVNTETSFWTLYDDISEQKNCRILYSSKCRAFHEEEIKVTTEYVHNEL